MVDEVNPVLFTVATLTGHAARSVGPYTALVENGVSKANGYGELLVEQGDLLADPCETSRSRREDYEFVQSLGVDPRKSKKIVRRSRGLGSFLTGRRWRFRGALEKFAVKGEEVFYDEDPLTTEFQPASLRDVREILYRSVGL